MTPELRRRYQRFYSPVY